VAQEAIRNSVKHSGAEHVSVSVQATDGRARLEVGDDGRGFDPTTAGGDGHFGLRAVEELVREAGGELEVDSKLGEGARVTVEVDT
jgi:signal transduction histidine kinase